MSRPYQDTLLDSFRNRYETGQDSWTTEPALKECTDFFLQSLPVGLKGRVLDIGTGRGRDAESFVKVGYDVTGIDLIETEEWRFLKEKWPKTLGFRRGDFLSCDTLEGPFHVIVDNGCFHHQQSCDYSRYLAKIRSLLASEGCFCLSVFTPNDSKTGEGHTSQMDGGRVGKYFSETELPRFLGAEELTILTSKKIYRPAFDRFYLAVVAKKEPR